MTKQKPFSVSKEQVWRAYKKIRSNRGSAGVDHESLEDFEHKLKDNLYKLWNRMVSGSYIPPPVLEVEIPKKGNGTRKLGIPTVSDRIAQMVVRDYLEPELEPTFHRDSYGYRPGKSAHDALDKARQLCWKLDWVIDIDIKGLFDNIDHGLLMRALGKHEKERWVLLYVDRWLKAPVQRKDGMLKARGKGTPQGGVISPLLANLFLHYTFDKWMEKNLPTLEFERYADDIIVHCKSLRQAGYALKRISERIHCCNLELHPGKTKIVYCKDGVRTGCYNNTEFDFLGYTFRGRKSKTKAGRTFVSFTAAVSKESLKKMHRVLRKMQIHRKTRHELKEIAGIINPVLRGWINYYGRYRRSALFFFLHQVNLRLIKWARWKYKRLRCSTKRSVAWLCNVYKTNPALFAHWSFGIKPKMV